MDSSGSEKTGGFPNAGRATNPLGYCRYPCRKVAVLASRGMGEKFATSLVTGTGSMTAHHRGTSPNLHSFPQD